MYIFNLTVFQNVAYRLELARIEKKYAAKVLEVWECTQAFIFFVLFFTHENQHSKKSNLL